ncbi:MAG: DUF4445 domain-containing protein [Opitutus sp.]|nr:DUF4445 domain-containing protein [Opitutus sp.]
MSRPQSIHVQWPDGASTLALRAVHHDGATLADQLAEAGRPLNTRCGRHGRCAGCTVELVAGRFLGRDGTEHAAPAEIKACQGRLAPGADTTIAVPARSLATHRPQVVTTFKVGVPAATEPLVPVVPGESDHGLAIDIGTTTVVVSLVDLRSGNIVREEASFNRQIELGDDVVTRIQLAGVPDKLDVLRDAIVGRTLAPLIAGVCAGAAIAPERLAGATVAGNTTMLHLLTGTDPTPMGVAPFCAAFLEHRQLTAANIGLSTPPPAMPVHLLPGISAYVGADLVAGCVCTGLNHCAEPSLLVDIGTNGEILLMHRGRLLATATAAGPAFEGGRLARGTRAVAGAVAHVRFDGEFPPALDLIPGANGIVGLCGSAYVDFLAQGRRISLLEPTGRISPSAWQTLPAVHRHHRDITRGVRLNAQNDATLVTEADVAHLLQAKAAIAAGIVTLLRRAGLAPADIRTLYLAGGFGLHLDVAHAIESGLLPGFRPEQIDVVGNTALGGAWLALIDRTVLPEMIAASTAAEVVELNLEPGFEDTFIDHLALP